MEITGVNLSHLGVGFKASFNAGLGGVENLYERVATTIQSTTAANEYGWLEDWPMMREWIGSRVLKELAGYDYTLKNKKYETTVRVKADDISDDNLGIYGAKFQGMGKAAGQFPDKLLFAMVALGFIELCYDGQSFFDTDHPVFVNGQETSVSNMQAGAGNPWFLLDTTQPLQPFIYQERQKPRFVEKTDPKASDHVFMNDEFLYGTDMRCNVGFALWQTAFGSKADLTEANFDAAYDAMAALVDDRGEPLGIKPNLLLVGGSNRKKAQEIVVKERKANGEDNVNAGLVDVLVAPRLL